MYLLVLSVMYVWLKCGGKEEEDIQDEGDDGYCEHKRCATCHCSKAKYDRKSLSPRRNFTLCLIYFLVLHHFHIIHGTLQYEMQFFSNVLYDTFFQCQHYLPTWLPFSTWSLNPLYL